MRSDNLPFGMLLGLTIRDVVLIERLSLAFRPALCVLTGETGAGKSILMDALGLALGRRADASLVRPGTEPDATGKGQDEIEDVLAWTPAVTPGASPYCGYAVTDDEFSATLKY